MIIDFERAGSWTAEQPISSCQKQINPAQFRFGEPDISSYFTSFQCNYSRGASRRIGYYLTGGAGNLGQWDNVRGLISRSTASSTFLHLVVFWENCFSARPVQPESSQQQYIGFSSSFCLSLARCFIVICSVQQKKRKIEEQR